MYGKAFSSMFEGSMYGAGPCVFAVWVYAISHAYDSRVELNEEKLAHTLGGTVEEVKAALEFLQRPDPRSRCKEANGARLVKVGEWEYYLPSWLHYQSLRSKQERREYMRQKMFEYRHRLAEENRNGKSSRVVKAKRASKNGKVLVEIPQTRGEEMHDQMERQMGPVDPPVRDEAEMLEAQRKRDEEAAERQRQEDVSRMMGDKAFLEWWASMDVSQEEVAMREYATAAVAGAPDEELTKILHKHAVRPMVAGTGDA